MKDEVGRFLEWVGFTIDMNGVKLREFLRIIICEGQWFEGGLIKLSGRVFGCFHCAIPNHHEPRLKAKNRWQATVPP